jgi:hypothetical protein
LKLQKIRRRNSGKTADTGKPLPAAFKAKALKTLQDFPKGRILGKSSFDQQTGNIYHTTAGAGNITAGCF